MKKLVKPSKEAKKVKVRFYAGESCKNAGCVNSGNNGQCTNLGCTTGCSYC